MKTKLTDNLNEKELHILQEVWNGETELAKRIKAAAVEQAYINFEKKFKKNTYRLVVDDDLLSERILFQNNKIYVNSELARYIQHPKADYMFLAPKDFDYESGKDNVFGWKLNDGSLFKQ